MTRRGRTKRGSSGEAAHSAQEAPKRIKQEDKSVTQELAVLRARYLEPQLRTDCELPGGMSLRRPRHSQIAIRQWPQIHRQVKLLEKEHDEIRLLWLLRKLRRHEVEGVPCGEPAPLAAVDAEGVDQECAQQIETIDMTSEDMPTTLAAHSQLVS
jgi:hypothetical protein